MNPHPYSRLHYSLSTNVLIRAIKALTIKSTKPLSKIAWTSALLIDLVDFFLFLATIFLLS